METKQPEAKPIPLCEFRLQTLKNPLIADYYSVPETDFKNADEKQKLDFLLTNLEKMHSRINTQLTELIPEFTESKEPSLKKPKND